MPVKLEAFLHDHKGRRSKRSPASVCGQRGSFVPTAEDAAPGFARSMSATGVHNGQERQNYELESHPSCNGRAIRRSEATRDPTDGRRSARPARAVPYHKVKGRCQMHLPRSMSAAKARPPLPRGSLPPIAQPKMPHPPKSNFPFATLHSKDRRRQLGPR